MKYRQYFGLSPKQFREEVDLGTFLSDLDMMRVESESAPKPPELSEN